MKLENIDVAAICAKARQLPKWPLLGGAFATFVLIAVIVGQIQDHAHPPTQRPVVTHAAASASRVAQTPAPRAAQATTSAASIPAVAPVPSTATMPLTAPTTGVGGSLTLILPPEIPPAGLAGGRADYRLDAAQPAERYGDTPGAWTTIGSSAVAAATSAFSSLPDKNLAAVTPGSGFVQETWSFWMQAKAAGVYVIAARLTSAPGAAATITIGGQPAPIVRMTSVAAGVPQTSIGSADLAEGWHSFTLTLTQRADQIRSTPTEVDLFSRGPNASAPVSFTPFAASAPTSATVAGVHQ